MREKGQITMRFRSQPIEGDQVIFQTELEFPANLPTGEKATLLMQHRATMIGFMQGHFAPVQEK